MLLQLCTTCMTCVHLGMYAVMDVVQFASLQGCKQVMTILLLGYRRVCMGSEAYAALHEALRHDPGWGSAKPV